MAKKNNDIFKLDVSYYSKRVVREYQLDGFNIEENIADEDECASLRGSEGLWFKIRRKLSLKIKRPQTYVSESRIVSLDEVVSGERGSMYLDGYWQDEKYFLSIRQDIQNDFTLKAGLSKDAEEYLESIQSCCSVSLHVRRGDYVENSYTRSVHGNCDIEYYKRTTSYINKNLGNPYFYIFSDDIAWCKENFGFLDNKVFVDNTQSALEDLELMKHCKHNIIANSSFSWWGAWLNKNEDKMIVAPKAWFAAWPDDHIAPKEWTRL